jgi:peptidyl-prolyl cis-trans isomerase D
MIKNFTKKKLAGLLLILVIIIAFGFGGFGGGFNIGNQNNIAKINNTNISTQDFMSYLNQSGLSEQVIKKNIDNNIIEELLTTLISKTLLSLEIKNLNLKMSENILIKKIKKNKNFHDENNKFKRTIYEKFLLTNNINAPIYELKLKENALQKQLFTYISSGSKSPKFLVNKFFKEKNKQIDIAYISLEKFYKKKNQFTENEILNFIKENSNKLKQDHIDFSYVIITPENLLGLKEFNQAFFDKIDEIDNLISKNIDFNTIVKELNIKPIIKKNYINLENKETIENKIYNSRKDKIEILDDNGSFIFYQIDAIKSKIPDTRDLKFIAQIKNLLFQKEKYEFNKRILDQINEKKFDQYSFDKLSINGVEKIKLNSIDDNTKFEMNSIEVIYSLPINSFVLVSDENKNIFVVKILSFNEKDLPKDLIKLNGISNQASAQNRNSILKSYDLLLNQKYKVVINEKTLDRVKNYFR